MIHTNGQHSSEPAVPAVVEGVVESVNATGVRVRGAWYSVSKFKPVALPEPGEHVRLAVDAKRFISSVEIVKAAHDDALPTITPVSSRDRQIARLSVLKSAAAFAATRTDIKSADVLRIADSWLAWVEA
jgi:hypothetical protein